MKQRCINFDWLEVYCLEPFSKPRDADYFASLGFCVQRREYGTPQYREMFIIKENEFPMIEIRRNPYSLKKDGGVFEPESCHLRLSNRACYLEKPIDYLRSFLHEHGFTFQSFARVDICLDFLKLDDGSSPGDFLQDYAREKYFKHHLSVITPRGVEVVGSNISGHGRDRQFARFYNSWSWGSPTSAISVKMYDKTLELGEAHDKFYIRDQWISAGLTTTEDNQLMCEIRDTRFHLNMTKKRMAKEHDKQKRETLRDLLKSHQEQLRNLLAKVKHIWRLEFSIKSDIKGFVRGDVNDTKKDGTVTMYPLDFHTLESRERCLLLFHSLAKKYFWFKIPSRTRNGTPQRKDRCEDYWPISYDGSELYKPVRLSMQKEPTRMDKIISNKLRLIIELAAERGGYNPEFLRSVERLLQYFSYTYRLHELERSHNELILECSRRLNIDFEKLNGQGHKMINALEELRRECLYMQVSIEQFSEKCEDF